MKYFPVLILLALPAPIAHAQNAVLATLPSDMQRFVVEADPTLAYRTENVPGGRWDLDAGVMRAVFRLPPTGEVAPTHEGTARAWMDAEADRFGWSSSDEFELERTIEGRYSAHLSFRQVFRGVKVFNRIVKVNLSADGHPTMVFSGYAPHLREFTDFNPAPAVGAGEAENLAKRAVHDGSVRATPAELVVYPAKVPRLAWRVVTWPEGVPLSWEVLLDARTGEVIYLHQLLFHGDLFKDFPKPAADPYHEPSHSPVRFVDGTGLVFDPDPLTTAGVEYGAPYEDSDDEDVPELNDERLEVDLLDITESDDGLYRLVGPYVEITGDPALGGTSWTPPAIADADSFLYGRADDVFEAVNLYYHVDKTQRYIQSLDIGHEVQEGPLLAHPHGLGTTDNAAYDPTLNAIMFGDGGIDDAEDAHVILHEYGHAILHEIVPQALYKPEGDAIHEGFGDYWAVSYTRGLIDDGTVPDRDWKKVFTWDGNESWEGRYLDHDGHYPEDTHCDSGGGLDCFPYEDGRFWATSMMDLWGELGGETTDRLILASQAYYSNNVTMSNTAETVVQADNDLYGGVHVGTITRVLGNRGLLDTSEAPPTVTHEPLTAIEDPSLGVTFTVNAVSNGPPVHRVSVYYSINEGPLVEIGLADGGDDTYDATVSLPDDTELLDYYVDAVASAGPSVLLPVGAPDSLYRVVVSYDTEAPTIAHDPFPAFVRGDWPAALVADVSDNRSVEEAWVAYTITEENGARIDEGTFALQRSNLRYRGSFPDLDLPPVATVSYRVGARDNAIAANETTLPAEDLDPFAFRVTEEGEWVAYDAEEADPFSASGRWERAEPEHGLKIAHSGSRVWMTDPDGPYPASAGLSTLTLPALRISEDFPAHLEFWHWYDFEHRLVQAPGPTARGDVFDGGNVHVSVDDGATWELLEPDQGRYSGPIREGFGNPLEGQPAYGGYSFGWRRVRAALPAGDAVRVRFAFATNDGNVHDSRFLAGWALDDVRIVLKPNADTSPPVVVSIPDARVTAREGTVPPPTQVVATDDSGIESAVVSWTYQSQRPSGSGTTLLAMDPEDRRIFRGTLGQQAPLDPGDHIAYRFVLTDFDGNSTTVPPPGQTALLLEVRRVEEVNVFAEARASGIWQTSGTGFTTGGSGDAPVSSVLLQAMDIPTVGDEAFFKLSHEYQFSAGVAGNVKIASVEKSIWSLLTPVGGYGATLERDPTHPMNREHVFGAEPPENGEAMFSLESWAGKQIHIRLDLAGVPAAGEFWTVHTATLEYSTPEVSFDFIRSLELHANFPDPFRESTTVNYTLPEALDVRIDVFNVLGQRVRTLRSGRQEAGTYTLTVPRGDLAAGLYFLHMVAGGKEFVERMIVVR